MERLAFESISTSAMYATALFTLHFMISPLFWKLWPNLKIPQVQLQNRTVSTVHAALQFILTAHYWATYNPRVKIIENSNYEAFCLDTMMGYLWYDIIIELFFTKNVEALGHHVLGIVSHLSSRISDNKAAAFYSMLVFIAEISTPFLNISWLLHAAGLKTDPIFALVSLLLMLTFSVRVCVGPFMVGHMLLFKSEWGDDTELLYWGNVVIVAAFALLNIYWYFKLLKMALSLTVSNTVKSRKKAD